MTLLATVAVDNVPGATVLGPWTVPDTDNQLVFSFANWAQAFTVALAPDVSLNAGVTWLSLGRQNPTPGGAASPRGPVSVTCAPLPLLCQCGVYYLPGVAAYDRSLDHSTVALKAGVTLSQLGQLVPFPVISTASFLKRILVDTNGFSIDEKYVDRVFHVPTPGVNPLRQVRATLTVAGGRVATTLTVTSSP